MAREIPEDDYIRICINLWDSYIKEAFEKCGARYGEWRARHLPMKMDDLEGWKAPPRGALVEV